ncbi:helix-turn-helix domain-containing protein [Actinokineospora cianjurensis]|uniref:Transcriptional regulator with XRE-family HTH domain n=1 Tax=Actinokineospora cianjurensis TaxID=585224 RepID=A0A421AYC2_9PSEU|nr:helix-turn-helix transcriptional regulator [Actinokineospora cianjurensis]RLK54857.1 transcriptional regulator with XRE-family HTH domain [Actinokineospora cianjurensis]
MADDTSLGARVKRARKRRQLTQEQFAEKAEVSVDLVRKLEQEVRHTASMSSLMRMAHALDIDVAHLLGQVTTIDAPVDEEAVGVLAIRDALTALDYFPGLAVENAFDADPPTVDRVRSALRQADQIRQEGEFARLGAVLPGLIAEARAAADTAPAADRAAAFGVLSEVLQIASTMMTGLGRPDIGYIGLIQAQESAAKASDEHLSAMNVSALSWVFFKQGRLDDAEAAALRQVAVMDPDFRRDPPQRLAISGILMLRAASAAVRNNAPERCVEHMSLAQAAAARVGRDRTIYNTPFGPTNAGIAAINAAVESEDFDRAVTLAADFDPAGVPPTWQARHHLDVAIAHSELDQDDQATTCLLRAEHAAPEWMRYHTLSRHTVRELAERARRRRAPIQQLADRLAIDL